MHVCFIPFHSNMVLDGDSVFLHQLEHELVQEKGAAHPWKSYA